LQQKGVKRFTEPFLIYLSKKNLFDKTNKQIEEKHFEHLFEANFDSFDTSRLFSSSTSLEDNELRLFFWALLTNRIEIAKIFWRLGKVTLHLKKLKVDLKQKKLYLLFFRIK